MKTSELTDAALNWAVAKCVYPDLVWGSSIGVHHASHQIVIPHLPEPKCYWNPSTDWVQGGPLIERKKISVIEECDGTWIGSIDGCTDLDMPLYQEHGPTPLIAAMRCYVSSKLGDNVDIPEGIL